MKAEWIECNLKPSEVPVFFKDKVDDYDGKKGIVILQSEVRDFSGKWVQAARPKVVVLHPTVTQIGGQFFWQIEDDSTRYTKYTLVEY